MDITPCLLFVLVIPGLNTDNTSIDQRATSAQAGQEVLRSPGSCLLPQHPRHGAYNSTLCHPNDQHPACQNMPGTPVPTQWLLRYSCHDGYDLTVNGYDLTANGYEYSECDDGNWMNPIDCVPSKTLSTNTSVTKYRPLNRGCRLPQYPQKGFYFPPQCRPEDIRAACRSRPGDPVPHSWLLQYSCSEGYVLSSAETEFSVCDNGTWVTHLDCVSSSSLSSDISINEVMQRRRRRRQSAPDKSVEGGCRLPEQPQHGAYVSVSCQPGDLRAECSNSPGTPVPEYWVLKYTCNDNYKITFGVSPVILCNGGTWGTLPDCINLCPPLKLNSLDIRCTFMGQNVPCEQPMKAGTRARAKCKQHYIEVYQSQNPPITCGDNGEWSSQLYQCKPVCGVSLGTNPLHSLIRDGTPTKQGDFPWLAALFIKNETGHWDQQCGGTLISSHIVLTAAHCLFNNQLGILHKPEEVKVGLGKYSRDYYTHENFSEIFDVREVLVPQSYSGRRSYYALDVGIIDLAVSVQVSGYILPACIEWTSSTEPNNGDVGIVAGWGRTEDTVSSDFVLSTQLAYLGYAACVKKLWRPLGAYLTTDKFCAETNSGGQVDNGDSGGGLTFVKNGLNVVFGVVSTKVSDVPQVTLFTNIKNPQHMKWLDEKRTYLEEFRFEKGRSCQVPVNADNRQFSTYFNELKDIRPGIYISHKGLLVVQCAQGYQFRENIGILFLTECMDGSWSKDTPECLRLNVESNTDCRTPNNSPGKCKNIKKCPELVDMLKRTHEPGVIDFLKKSQCGFDNKDPLVCCPMGKPSMGSAIADNILPGLDECGISHRHNTSRVKRVVNGKPALLGSWPWMVALGYISTNQPLSWLCGASLISNRYVVTTAHCVTGIGSRTLYVARVGDLNLDDNVDDDASPIDIPVDKVISHEDYNAKLHINDIALIKLKDTVQFTELIRPICLPESNTFPSDLAGYSASLTGWGRSSLVIGGRKETALLEAELEITDFQSCAKAYANNSFATIDNTVICALTPGKDACQGDAGGPLMLPTQSNFFLIGITSYGQGCANPNYPGVYTRVSAYTDWIKKNIS